MREFSRARIEPPMSRQDANSAFARTSFLYGGNAAYIEDLYAKYETDPAAVDAEWQDFFRSLKDDGADVVTSAQGASWKQPNWPLRAFDDVGALVLQAPKKVLPLGVDRG